jgi:hypothetical protein
MTSAELQLPIIVVPDLKVTMANKVSFVLAALVVPSISVSSFDITSVAKGNQILFFPAQVFLGCCCEQWP